ncbi:hypothetical protein EJ04DRAFT_456395, partial [Polyplosphaeria fusca]
MGDDDEDLIYSNGNNEEDVDPTEEAQDFGSLLKFTDHDTGNLSLPKRGEKDFESHATNLQENTLEASRQAMQGVLSWGRVHTPKQHILAMYHPESNMAYVEKAKSQHFQTIGRAKGNTQWLLPEEALFLIERGTLDCRWPVPKDDGDDAPSSISDGAPMSLQGAYATFIGLESGVGGKLTPEMYTVYASLKRSGYIVFRSGTWNEERGILQPAPLNSTPEKDQPENSSWFSSFFRDVWRRLTCPNPHVVGPDSLRFGPLVKPGLYRNYADIYRLLQLIPSHDAKAPPTFLLPPDASNPYRITFEIWKATHGFRKSARRSPDFRVAVVNARETGMPTAAQLNDLLATTPYDPPKEGSSLYQKLKQGNRNVVLAVVDNGVPSYMNISAPQFADEKLYEDTRPVRGGKGGRGRGRGRARGRGR